jgi:hypothetical protein
MMFPHWNIHKTPEPHNQIDHVLMGGRSIPFKYTQCTIFQGWWLWYWSLYGDCKTWGKIGCKYTSSIEAWCGKIYLKEAKWAGGKETVSD